MSNEMLSPHEPLTDDQGKVTRTWWRFFNTKISQIGTTTTPLVVTPSAILAGGTVSAGGTIAAADLPGHSLIGNPLADAGVPQAVSLNPSLAFSGTTLGLTPLQAGSLLGNAGTVAAIPGAIAIGSGLTLDPASSTLSAGGSSGGDDETVAYSLPDRSGQIAAVERKANDALALALLAQGGTSQAASASITVNPDSLFGNPGTVASTGTSIAIGSGLSLSLAGTLTATGSTSLIYAPLVNGDLPGPTLMADSFGQCVMVQIR